MGWIDVECEKCNVTHIDVQTSNGKPMPLCPVCNKPMTRRWTSNVRIQVNGYNVANGYAREP